MDSKGILQSNSFPTISIVVPVYRGEQTLTSLVKRIDTHFFAHQSLKSSFLSEVIFVCDDPEDDSERLLRELRASFNWINIITLSKNSGQHLATAVGFMHTRADWVVTIDEDLHHPPELIVQMLKHALTNSFDLVYAKSTIKTHKHSIYRDLASFLSKTALSFFSKQDFRSISSFRLMRGDIARAVASAADSVCYLDVDIFRFVGSKRVSTLYSSFQDNRSLGPSGYNLLRLLRHYNKMVFSANLSLLSIIATIGFASIVGIIIQLISMFTSGHLNGIQQVAPGWLSLFLLLLFSNTLLVFLLVYLLQTISMLLYRSSGYASFLFINRENDLAHLNSIAQLD